ncbi:MAG: class IV adenylate cyclase [Promethearchaeota archaeon]
MIEVEIKAKISDPDLMRKKFEENLGIYKISLIHEDIYYNMPIGLRDFKKTDEALRLRKSRRFDKRLNKNEHGDQYYITYKGKRIDDLTKTREEIDIKIENIEKMKKIFENLGFQEVLTVKKERELYEFKLGTYHIEALIDYVPFLGQHFIEVEYLCDSEDQVANSREILFEFLNKLGIQKKDSIRKSYLELILES